MMDVGTIVGMSVWVIGIWMFGGLFITIIFSPWINDIEDWIMYSYCGSFFMGILCFITLSILNSFNLRC